jgi:hypothetical protein
MNGRAVSTRYGRDARNRRLLERCRPEVRPCQVTRALKAMRPRRSAAADELPIEDPKLGSTCPSPRGEQKQGGGRGDERGLAVHTAAPTRRYGGPLRGSATHFLDQRQQNALETCARSMWRLRVKSIRGVMESELSRRPPRRSISSGQVSHGGNMDTDLPGSGRTPPTGSLCTHRPQRPSRHRWDHARPAPRHTARRGPPGRPGPGLAPDHGSCTAGGGRPVAAAAHPTPNRSAALFSACPATRLPRTRPASSAERVWMPE